MSVEEKTKNLVRRMWPVDKIDANPDNPNEMSAAEFNMLYDNVEAMGITDPLFCIPHPEKECDPKKGKGWLMLIGGEHRWEVAKLMELKQVPVTINTDPEFDRDLQKFQMVRHNIIHGQMSAQKFTQLYDSLSKKYDDEIASEMFGFVEQEEFLRLLKRTKESLPPEMQDAFQEATKEIKTINDLTQVLNHLFNTYGDTLEYNYMIVDYGDKESVWLRMSAHNFDTFKEFAAKCKDASKAVDHLVNALIERANEDPDFMAELAEDLPDVEIAGDVELGTLDFLDGLAEETE